MSKLIIFHINKSISVKVNLLKLVILHKIQFFLSKIIISNSTLPKEIKKKFQITVLNVYVGNSITSKSNLMK